MEENKSMRSLNVNEEPNTSGAKKVLLSNTSFASLSARNISKTRLPSFKPPRDLFLTGNVTSNIQPPYNFGSGGKSCRKTFAPNVNVTRKKGSGESPLNHTLSDSNQKNKVKDKIRKSSFIKRRNSNIIQTKGVFSEGLALEKIRTYNNSAAVSCHVGNFVPDKPKLNLKKMINKNEEDVKLKSLLRDNFIDDDNHIPDITYTPKCLPMICNVQNTECSGNLEKTFEMLQTKWENTENSKVQSKKVFAPIVECETESTLSPKIFLFEFPSLLGEKENTCNKKKTAKEPADREPENKKSVSLSSLGEGFFGHLRIHENGRAFLVTCKNNFPLWLYKHESKQELMSACMNTETNKGEVIDLGRIDASFTCAANIFQSFR